MPIAVTHQRFVLFCNDLPLNFAAAFSNFSELHFAFIVLQSNGEDMQSFKENLAYIILGICVIILLFFMFQLQGLIQANLLPSAAENTPVTLQIQAPAVATPTQEPPTAVPPTAEPPAPPTAPPSAAEPATPAATPVAEPNDRL